MLHCIIQYVNHSYIPVHFSKSTINNVRKLTICKEYFGFRMIENERNCFRIQSDIYGIQNCTRHGHTEMGFVQGRYVGCYDRNRLSPLYSQIRERRRQLVTASIRLFPSKAQFIVNQGKVVRIDSCGFFLEIRPGREVKSLPSFCRDDTHKHYSQSRQKSNNLNEFNKYTNSMFRF